MADRLELEIVLTEGTVGARGAALSPAQAAQAVQQAASASPAAAAAQAARPAPSASPTAAAPVSSPAPQAPAPSASATAGPAAPPAAPPEHGLPAGVNFPDAGGPWSPGRVGDPAWRRAARRSKGLPEEAARLEEMGGRHAGLDFARPSPSVINYAAGASGGPSVSGPALAGPGGPPASAAVMKYAPGMMPGAAGAEAGALSGSAALGPVGAVVAAAVIVKEKVLGSIAAVGEGAKAAAEPMRALASNDNLGALVKTSGLAAEGLKKFGVIGEVAGTALKSLTDTFEAAAGVVESFVARGRQLAAYSPELAQAGARADVTSMMADIREAQELGPELAKLTNGQTDLIAELREMLLPIKKFIVEVLADLVEWFRELIVDWRKEIMQTLAVIVGVLQIIAHGVTLQWGKIGDDLSGIDDKLAEIRDQAEAARRKDSALDMEKFFAATIAALRQGPELAGPPAALDLPAPDVLIPGVM